MGSLGLHADPDGWLNAGYSVRTLMDSLDSELYDADRIGGAGLSRAWAGPVAEAFTGHWSGVRSRAEDLIAQGRRAAGAMTDFGGKLEDFVKRAADLERYWLSFGLQIGLDGMHFALPWGFEQLSPVHQVSFHQWLTESERDVTAMWADIRAAVDDVVTVLESLIAVFDDFQVLEFGAAAGLIGGYLDGYLKNPASLASDAFAVLRADAESTGKFAMNAAIDVMVTTGKDASRDVLAAADVATRDALGAASLAEKIAPYAKWGARVALVGAVALTVWQTYDTARTKGWVDGFEDHADAWVGLAAGIGVGAALGAVGAPVLGAVVLSGIVAVGVGDVAQWYVDGHRKQVGHVLTDIGHAAADAATWEVRQARFA